MATLSQRGRPISLPRTAPRIGKTGKLALVVAVMLAGYALLRDDFPWPEGLIAPVAERFDSIYEWVVDNEDSNWVFVYVLTPFSDFLDWLVNSLTELLGWLTWIGVAFAGTLVTWRFGGGRVALLVLATFASFGLMGLWAESMETLSLMTAAVLVSLAIGIPLGVLAGRNDTFQRLITPVLDAMQIVPAFAYLMPVVILFSVGNPAAVIATVIYAVPPAVRITALGIRGVAHEAVEAADSLGATGFQVLTRVQLPLARRAIMLGVNQTIMMALSMVVIASLIGGGGLGDTVISALTYLDVGEAMIAGLAIVFMAIALDRSTEAAGNRTDPTRNHVLPGAQQRRERMLTLGMFAAIVVGALIARAAGVGAIYPEEVTIGGTVYETSFRDSLTDVINEVVEWVQDPSGVIYPITSTIGDWIVTYALEPLRLFLVGTPWWLVVGGVTAIALIVSGLGPAITAGLMLAAIGVMGAWDPAMNTASQVLVAITLTLVIGFGVGVWAAENPRVERLLRPVLDALQTLPQFVYLIPVVALFNIGRVPGVIASVAYAVPVVVRLVTVGLRDVAPTAVEAAASFGASRRQLLLKVKIPMARPAIMLGVNQGIVMVLAVVIVAGLVGGGGLGYGVVLGLQRNLFGEGAVASLAILALGIVLDRVTQGSGSTRTPGRA
jgi:glycine betaine/proline transport system permease protein